MYKIHIFTSDILDTKCYVIENVGSLIVIDPCVKKNTIEKQLSQKVEAVLLTHAHFDHILCIKDYVESNIPIYMHKNAYEKVNDSTKNISNLFTYRIEVMIKKEIVNMVYNDYIINEKNGLEIRVLYTPGHSDCSVCYLLDKYLFTGDTIFNNGVGRTDLFSGNEFQLMKSVQRLAKLNQDLVIYPGHGEPTTLFYELSHNKHLNERYLRNYKL